MKTKSVLAPAWATVKIHKRDYDIPTEAIAYWDEYAPEDLSLEGSKFWRNIPHRMLPKCAIALGMRQAYPSLSGLFVPEEMMRNEEEQELTPEGRRITYESAEGPHADKDKVAEQKIKDLKEKIEVNTQSKIIDAKKEESKVIDATKTAKTYKGEWVLDWRESATHPTVTGDIAEVVESLERRCFMKWGADSFWHLEVEYVENLRICAYELNYKLTELRNTPQTTNAKPQAKQEAPKAKAQAKSEEKPAKTRKPPANAEEWQGLIEQANTQTGTTKPYVDVLFKRMVDNKIKKGWSRCFDHKLFEFLLAGKGEEATLVMSIREKDGKTYANIVGLVKIGRKEFTDGHIPVTQVRDREAGGQKTLY
jgi:hypothetical protein